VEGVEAYSAGPADGQDQAWSEWRVWKHTVQDQLMDRIKHGVSGGCGSIFGLSETYTGCH